MMPRRVLQDRETRVLLKPLGQCLCYTKESYTAEYGKDPESDGLKPENVMLPGDKKIAGYKAVACKPRVVSLGWGPGNL